VEGVEEFDIFVNDIFRRFDFFKGRVVDRMDRMDLMDRLDGMDC
jgi:hypothetical protein